MVKRNKPIFRNAAPKIARKCSFLDFTLILINTLSPTYPQVEAIKAKLISRVSNQTYYETGALMTQKDQIKQLLLNLERRLFKLKEQKALYGFSADPRLLIEIEDTEIEIQGLNSKLLTLETLPDSEDGPKYVVNNTGYLDSITEYSSKRFARSQQNVLDDIEKTLEIMAYRPDEQELAFMEYIPASIPSLDRFIDRDAEFKQLLDDARSGHSIVITGIAGIGKTQLAAKLKKELSSNNSIAYWHSFAATDSIDSLIVDLAAFWVSQGKTRSAYLLARSVETSSVVRSLLKEVRENKVNLFFDNYETVNDKSIDDFVKEILLPGGISQIVLTTRQMPSWMTIRDIVNWEIKTIELDGFPLDITIDYLRTYGVSLTKTTLKLIQTKTNGHPLLLDLLTSQIIAYELDDGDIVENFTELNIEIEQYLLNNIFGDLRPIEKELLTYFSVSFIKLNRKDINSLLSDKYSDAQILDGLLELERKRLVHKTKFDYSIHAIVRDYIYERIPNVKTIHSKMANVIYQSKIETSKVIQEVYRHYKLADEFSSASNVVHDKFSILWANGYREWSQDALVEMTTFFEGNGDIYSAVNDHMLLARIALESCKWDIVNENYRAVTRLNEFVKDECIDAYVYNNWAEVHARQGIYDKAILSYQSSHEILSKDHYFDSLIPLHNLAATHARYGDLENAKKYCRDTFHEFNSAGRIDLLTKSASLQALISFEAEDFDSALEWCNYDLEFCKNRNDQNGVARILNNSGVILATIGEIEQAKDRIQKSLIFNEDQGDMHAKAQAEANLGMIYQIEGDYANASSYYLNAYNVFSAIDDQVSLIEIYENVQKMHSEYSKLFRFSLRDSLKNRKIKSVVKGLRFLWNISYGYLPLS